MIRLETSSDLIRRLQSILTRQRLVLFSAGVLLTAAVLLAVWWLLAMVANVVVLPVSAKLVLLAVSAVVTVFFFARFALQRLFSGDVDSVALALEGRYPDLKGRLVAAVQFSRQALRSGFSPELIKATETQALERAGGIDFNSVVSFAPVLKTGRMFLVSAVLAVATLIIAPGLFQYAIEVYSNPVTKIAPPVAYTLTAFPGSTEWVKYRDLTLGGAVVGVRLPEKAVVHYRLAGGNWQKSDVDLRSIGRTAVTEGDSVSFGMVLRQVYRSVDYYVEAGALTSETYQIDVVDRPRVTGINLSLFYPDYTGLQPSVIDELNGSFSAVVGSRVNMKLELNLPVATAELVFDDSSRVPLKVNGKMAEASLVVDKSRSYHIELTDHLGERNPDPIEYYVTAVPDEYPSIDVIRPGFDVNLGDEMVLPLLVRIFDDYGFTSLVMKFQTVLQGRASEEHVAVMHYSEKIKTQGDIEFNWDMDRLNLFPGDYVSYYFEVADNDVISGPKIGRTRKYIARVPSLEEIVNQTEQESLKRINRTEELLEEGRELTKRLKEAARKLESKTPDAKTSDWSQQKELEAIARQNEEMLQQIQDLAQNMNQSLDRLEQTTLMSSEIMNKLQEIQKLFQEVATSEMLEAQQQMIEALKNMDPQQLQEAMRNMEMSQEELMQRLERTLALLKVMHARQKIEAMMRKAEELVERQNSTNEEAEKANKESLPQLSEAEEQTKAGLEDLKKDAKELEDMLKEAGIESSPELDKFLDAVKKSDAGENMQKMSEALKKSERQNAGEQGKQAQSKLSQMLNQMQEMQMAMNTDDNQETMKEMRRAMDHANQLSRDQETLIRETQAIDPRSTVLREVATEQQDLIRSCAGLMQLIQTIGQQSPFLGMEIQSLVATAMQNMDLATQGLESKRAGSAVGSQHDAMYNLNRATLRLMESMEQQSQCNKPNNMDMQFQKLNSMCQKQNQLNKETTMQCNNPGSCSKPKMSASGQQSSMPQPDGSQQGLQRLAAEQGAIRKSMQELEHEFGGSRQVLGRLSDIADEMKKVEESLQSGEAGPETTERQLRIYSRMLEASRSLQRKDFSEQRKAATASEQPVYLPPSLPQGMFNDDIKLEDRLRHFMGEDYPPQYEEQIKAYFKALLKAEADSRGAGTSMTQ